MPISTPAVLSHPAPMVLFCTATLAPLPLIAAAAAWGGAWVAVAVLWLTLLTASLDELIHSTTPPTAQAEFPTADRLSALLAVGHFAILGLVIWALSARGAAGWLTLPEKAGVFVAAGLFMGQVSNANAHELIHRSGRGLRRLGVWVYASVLFGHHASAHPLVHHVRVATRGDPASARLGESFYRFLARAWRGGFREGWRAEAARLARADRPVWRHPYVGHGAASLSIAIAVALVGGWLGLAIWLGLSGFAQVQLMMSDYVQHYGLTRVLRPDGRPEPVGECHSWNSPHFASSAMMLNAPRHSDHHAHPARPYPALRLPAATAAPMLPRSLPVMCCLALWPRQWRRVMDPRARAWAGRGSTGRV